MLHANVYVRHGVRRKKIELDRLPPQPGLTLTRNLAENWRRFEQQYDVYVELASGVITKGDKIQSMMLGPDAIDVYKLYIFLDRKRSQD